MQATKPNAQQSQYVKYLVFFVKEKISSALSSFKNFAEIELKSLILAQIER